MEASNELCHVCCLLAIGAMWQAGTSLRQAVSHLALAPSQAPLRHCPTWELTYLYPASPSPSSWRPPLTAAARAMPPSVPASPAAFPARPPGPSGRVLAGTSECGVVLPLTACACVHNLVQMAEPRAVHPYVRLGDAIK